MNQIKKIGRNKFLGIIGLGTVIGFLSSIIPIKFFSNKNFNKKEIALKIHPSAVKRNNKV